MFSKPLTCKVNIIENETPNIDKIKKAGKERDTTYNNLIYYFENLIKSFGETV